MCRYLLRRVKRGLSAVWNHGEFVPEDIVTATSDWRFNEMSKQARFVRLKKVSGRLRRMLTGESGAEASEMPRMLIVDDEGSICFSMSEYFGLHGYQVATARELDEAERLIELTKYAVAILDLRLGLAHSADGLEIIKLLHERQPQTRIVVLTAYGSAEMEDEARQLGAHAFLRKPTPLSQVAQVIQGLLDSPSKHARSA
jgi:CheY-like chemotaxis protein